MFLELPIRSSILVNLRVLGTPSNHDENVDHFGPFPFIFFSARPFESENGRCSRPSRMVTDSLDQRIITHNSAEGAEWMLKRGTYRRRLPDVEESESQQIVAGALSALQNR
jgi:hypothetical protein